MKVPDMRELKYYVACTVDRFIAAEDGSIDSFLSEGEHFTDMIESFPETFPGHLRKTLGVHAANKCFDDVLMGRKTYEVGLHLGITSPYPHLKQYVFSSSLGESPDENVELVTGDALTKVRKLKEQAGKDIWLCGGGKLAAALFPEIDELILKVNPAILGSGIPLFAGDVGPAAVDLVDSKTYSNGFVFLRYRVSK